jgi:hypothetical protein
MQGYAHIWSRKAGQDAGRRNIVCREQRYIEINIKGIRGKSGRVVSHTGRRCFQGAGDVMRCFRVHIRQETGHLC